VLAVLAELEPLAPVGPVELADVQHVLAPRLRDTTGGPYPFVTFYLNDEDIRFRNGFATPVTEGDEITVVLRPAS